MSSGASGLCCAEGMAVLAQEQVLTNAERVRKVGIFLHLSRKER